MSATRRHGKTCLGTFYQQGCAKIRVPARPAGRTLEAILINTAGGMTGGDRLDWELEAGPGANLAVTTQACERIYKTAGGTASTTVTIKAAGGSTFAWMPQETIFFDNCAFGRTITADLDATASALFVEAMIFGRRAMGESVRTADIRDRWRIRQNGRLLHAEDFRIGGDVARVLDQPAVAGGMTALATILLVEPEPERHLESVRKLAGKTGAASAWNGKLVARLAACDGYTLRNKLIPVLQLLAPDKTLPKVWSC